MPGTGVGDKAQDFGLVKVDTLKVGDATFTHQVFGALDFIPHEVEGVPMQGMVGFEVFKRFVTRIDYGRHVITLIEPKAFDPADAGTPVKFDFNGELPQVAGMFEGIPAKFDIDTGARTRSRSPHPSCRPTACARSIPWASRRSMAGASAAPRAPTSRAARSSRRRGQGAGRRDPRCRRRLAARSPRRATPAMSAATSSSRFVVTFDYGDRGDVPEAAAATGGRRRSLRRSGMWINGAPDGFEVMDVTPTALPKPPVSPARRCHHRRRRPARGLHPGLRDACAPAQRRAGHDRRTGGQARIGHALGARRVAR